MKRENHYKATCLKSLAERCPEFVILPHQDVRTNGVPDVSISARRRTSWWEFKHATPDFDSPGIQELTMRRLAKAGHAWYVIYYEHAGQASTLVVHPEDLSRFKIEAALLDSAIGSVRYAQISAGINHQTVIDFMRLVHGLK